MEYITYDCARRVIAYVAERFGVQKNRLTIILVSIVILVFSGCSKRPGDKPLDTPGLYVGDIINSESTTQISVPVTIKRENSDIVTVEYRVAQASSDVIDDVEGLEAIDIADVAKYLANMGSPGNTNNADFMFTSGTLAFAPGDADTKNIFVDIVNDTLFEKSEVFVVVLSNSTKANIVDSTGIVVIENDDPIPVATLALVNSNDQTALEEGDAPVVQLKVSLDAVSGVDAKMNITPNVESKDNSASVGVTAAYRVDYLIKQNSAPLGSGREIVLKPGETELLLDLQLIDDGAYEKTEALSLEISALSDVVTPASGLDFTINDNDTMPAGSVGDVPLNDTGLLNVYPLNLSPSDIEDCGGGDGDLCAIEVANLTEEYAQHVDANIGRDVTHNDNSNGNSGFDFTKLDSSGLPTTAVVTKDENDQDIIPWDCVKDNNTGLIWEVKLDGNDGLRAESRDIHWYDPNFEANGGVTGETGDFNCSETSYSSCNTSYYVADVNASQLCGLTGWRLPTIDELRSIVDYSKRNGAAYDTNYFAGDIGGNSNVWSSTSYAADPSQAWTIHFGSPVTEAPSDKTISVLRSVRLVNASQINVVQ